MYNLKQLLRKSKKDLAVLLSEKTDAHFFPNSDKPTKSEISFAILAHQRVEEFNQKKPLEVEWRIHKQKPFRKVKPRTAAFVPKYSQFPAVFFEGISGFCLITDDFIRF